MTMTPHECNKTVDLDIVVLDGFSSNEIKESTMPILGTI